jgi:hypothetical protein
MTSRLSQCVYHFRRQISRYFSLLLLRLSLGSLHHLDADIYVSPRFLGVAFTIGPIILLSARIVSTATPRELSAIVAHEYAHTFMHPGFLRRLFASQATILRQEIEADTYVKSLGLGADLASVLSRNPSDSRDNTHLPTPARIIFLTTP